MKIRKLKKEDIEEIVKIIEKNYDKFYANLCKKELKSLFEFDLPQEYLVAIGKKRVLGFVGYSQSDIDYHVYEIFWVNVDPFFQNKGIGTELVKKVISNIKNEKGENKYASMILLTARRPDFYRSKFGFKTIAKVKLGKDLMALKV